MSLEMHDKDNKIYIVLGAPHSATSFIAKALKDQGVEMGNSHQKDYYESRNFVWANDYIFSKAGGKWNRLPSKEAIEAVDFDDNIKRVVEYTKRKSKGKFWGWKDPRTSFTLQKYLPHLDGDVYLIACFRKPSRIEKDFPGRRGVSKDVTDKYNKALIENIKEFCEL